MHNISCLFGFCNGYHSNPYSHLDYGFMSGISRLHLMYIFCASGVCRLFLNPTDLRIPCHKMNAYVIRCFSFTNIAAVFGPTANMPQPFSSIAIGKESHPLGQPKVSCHFSPAWSFPTNILL